MWLIREVLDNLAEISNITSNITKAVGMQTAEKMEQDNDDIPAIYVPIILQRISVSCQLGLYIDILILINYIIDG